MFAGTQGDGIYRSSDHGNTWTKTDVNNSLLAHQLVFAFCVKDNALYAGADQRHLQIDRRRHDVSTDPKRFSTEHKRDRILLNRRVAATFSRRLTISFLASDGLEGIFYSPDDGSNWHQANLPLDPTFVSAVASDGTSRAYAGVYGQSFSVTGLYQSTDAGITWVSRTDVLQVDIERLAVKGSNVLAATLFSRLFFHGFW